MSDGEGAVCMLLTLHQISDYLKCDSGTARIYIDRFSLPHEKKGKMSYWYIEYDKLEDLKAFYKEKTHKNTRYKKK